MVNIVPNPYNGIQVTKLVNLIIELKSSIFQESVQYQYTL